jgi:hypothetical protein
LQHDGVRGLEASGLRRARRHGKRDGHQNEHQVRLHRKSLSQMWASPTTIFVTHHSSLLTHHLRVDPRVAKGAVHPAALISEDGFQFESTPLGHTPTALVAIVRPNLDAATGN